MESLWNSLHPSRNRAQAAISYKGAALVEGQPAHTVVAALFGRGRSELVARVQRLNNASSQNECGRRRLALPAIRSLIGVGVHGYAHSMKTAGSIPDDVFEEAERPPRRTKKSRSQLFSEALKEHAARHAPEDVTEAMNRSFSGGVRTWVPKAGGRCPRGRPETGAASPQWSACLSPATFAGKLPREMSCCRPALPDFPGTPSQMSLKSSLLTSIFSRSEWASFPTRSSNWLFRELTLSLEDELVVGMLDRRQLEPRSPSAQG